MPLPGLRPDSPAHLPQRPRPRALTFSLPSSAASSSSSSWAAARRRRRADIAPREPNVRPAAGGRRRRRADWDREGAEAAPRSPTATSSSSAGEPGVTPPRGGGRSRRGRRRHGSGARPNPPPRQRRSDRVPAAAAGPKGAGRCRPGAPGAPPPALAPPPAPLGPAEAGARGPVRGSRPRWGGTGAGYPVGQGFGGRQVPPPYLQPQRTPGPPPPGVPPPVPPRQPLCRGHGPQGSSISWVFEWPRGAACLRSGGEIPRRWGRAFLHSPGVHSVWTPMNSGAAAPTGTTGCLWSPHGHPRWPMQHFAFLWDAYGHPPCVHLKRQIGCLPGSCPTMPCTCPLMPRHLPKASQSRRVLCKGSHAHLITDATLSALSSSQNSHHSLLSQGGCERHTEPSSPKLQRVGYKGARLEQSLPVQRQTSPAKHPDLMWKPHLSAETWCHPSPLIPFR